MLGRHSHEVEDLALQHVAEPNLIGQSATSLKVIWHGQYQDI
jgi:hypothetical protein